MRGRRGLTARSDDVQRLTEQSGSLSRLCAYLQMVDVGDGVLNGEERAKGKWGE